MSSEKASSMPVDPSMPGSSGKALALPTGPAALASRTDETLIRLSKLFKTTAGLGSFLSVSSYTLYIVAYLHMKSPSRTQLIAKLSSLLGRPLPKLQAAAGLPAPALSPFAPTIGLLNDTRFAIRLTGLVPMYVMLRGLLKNKNPKDAVLHKVALLQVSMYITFQMLENLWVLSNKAVLSPEWVQKRGGAAGFMKWCCRAWLVAITCDFVRLGREAMLAKEQQKEKKMSQAELNQAEVKWWTELFTATAWYPMAIHYSLEKGIGLNQGLVGLSGMLGGFAGFSRAWAATKE